MRTFLFFILLVPLTALVSGQTSEEIRDFFNEGTFFFTRGDYKEASYYLKKVVEYNPDNAHYNYMLGECYMNIPGEEALAIPCFEKATKQTVAKNKYRGRDFSEESAPLHAWFYLGNVYRINNRLGDALYAYDTFVRSPFYAGNYNLNIVENEIKSCERAKIILDSPVDVEEVALDTVINTSAAEVLPVVSGDGQSLVFVRRLKFYDAVFYTTGKGDSWSTPVNLNPFIGSDGDFYPASLSIDGNELYLVRTTADNSDLYVSYLRNGTWSKAEPLGKNLNSKADETSASLSSDGKTLWFASSRRGGRGGLDIYYAQRNSMNGWGRAKNAGKIINTMFDEDCPHTANGDKTLFFSSKGHFSMGGYDIFYATLNGNTWNDPINTGSPVNSTADNLGFVPLNDGVTGYYSKMNLSGSNSEDIFRVTFKSFKPAP